MRADLLNQPVRLERVAGGFTKRTRSSRFPAVRGTVRLQNEGAMGRKSRQPRFVFTKRTPDRVAGGRRFYKTNPLVPVSGGARSRSGYKTKPRWGEVALTPIRFHKTNPRPCSVRKAVLQFEPARPVSGGARSRSGYKTKARWAGSRAAPDSFSQNEPPTVRRAEGSFTIRTRSSGFRRCAVAVRLQTPQRHEVGALQGKPAASGTIRQMQFSPRLMLPRFLRSRFSEYVPTTMELDPVIADRLSLRDGSY